MTARLSVGTVVVVGAVMVWVFEPRAAAPTSGLSSPVAAVTTADAAVPVSASAAGSLLGALAPLAASWGELGWGLVGALLGFIPLYLVYWSYKSYKAQTGERHQALRQQQQQLHAATDLHLATLEALAMAIDAKDQTSPAHIRRVQHYALRLAQALDMTDDEIQGVRTAAVLHDIGKLAVPEHILSKTDALTPEEFQKIRVHPQVGADIVAGVAFPYPVAPFILSHHERWDGKGYPQGLKGEDIPLGARIISVVDFFDALTSDRPYHRAMTLPAALTLLHQEAGKALDPRIVDLFVEMLPKLREESAAFETAAASPALERIAHAHREIHTLYEIAQTMGTSLGVSDTIAMIAARLDAVVPFATCALFLVDETHDALQCRYATGVEADALGTLSVRCGQGLSGWVAANRRPIVNGRPSADLEAAGLASRPTALQSALVMPLVSHDRLIGTLAVYHTTPDFYSAEHRRLLHRVADHAAAVIQNAIVFEQTQEDSLTDPLTGLPNTRFMRMHLTRELARAARLKSDVAMLVMDLDDFKDINDTHGHHVGDRALLEVAKVLRGAIRPYDMCVRYAGDEFIVVLAGCGQDEAERKRAELQRAVDQLQIEVVPGRRIGLAISVGAAIYPQDGDTYEALMAVADSRMYRDKTRRRQTRVPQGATGAPPEPTDLEIRRAGIGVL